MAAEFDGLYTEMTGLQRALIAAQRSGAADDAPTELVDRADVFLAAWRAADWAQTRGDSPLLLAHQTLDRKAALTKPIDPDLFFQTLSRRGREFSYALLAEGLRSVGKKKARKAAFPWPVVDYLAAPYGTGSVTASALADHWNLQRGAILGALPNEVVLQLCDDLDHAAENLPIRIGPGLRVDAAANRSGDGEGLAVLGSWIKGIAPLGPARGAAVAAMDTKGWATDALDVAEQLHVFTATEVAPLAIADWADLAAISDDRERLRALRALAKIYRDRRDDEAFEILKLAGDGLFSLIKGRDARAKSPDAWGSSTPLSLARAAALRFGNLLNYADGGKAAALVSCWPRT